MEAIKKEQLTAKVHRLILQGYGKSDVIEWINKEHPKENGAKLYKKVISHLSDNTIGKAGHLGFCRESVRFLYQKMVESGDYTGALRAIQELAKLSDSYRTAKDTCIPAADETSDTIAATEPGNSEEILRLIKAGDAA